MDSHGGGLELGLSLCAGRGSGSGGGDEMTNVPSGRRILTAKDLPNGFSTTRAAGLSGQAIGWPPVGSYRMNNLITQTKSAHEEEDKSSHLKPSKKFNSGSNYKSDQAARKDIIKVHIRFVKVNMDGLPIGRKVDLKAHICYETLAQAIEDMFFKSSTKTFTSSSGKKLLDGSSEFVLTYEDKDGDWMLVGDVPWGMFLSTVKRLRIMRTSEANGLAPRIPIWN